MSNRLFDPFTSAYLECALWSSTDFADGEEVELDNYSFGDIADETITKIIQDCATFQEQNAADLKLQGEASQNGHDLWLTRNMHGVGYWDRNTDDVGERLTTAAEAIGYMDLYIGDDGKIYGA
jgi:hypothetical protein|tara:strand:+ start:1072 stop:1440 length:369 start_codon:yes stop_codon:yes gene_type:complete